VKNTLQWQWERPLKGKERYNLCKNYIVTEMMWVKGLKDIVKIKL